MVCLDTAYFVKNWKYCNKIIFKYVNIAVRPILKKKIRWKKRFVSPVNSAWDPLEKHHSHKTHFKKKNKNADVW